MYKYGRLFCIALGVLTITGCRDTEVANKNTEDVAQIVIEEEK